MAGIGELPLAWTEKKGLSACEEHIFQNEFFCIAWKTVFSYKCTYAGSRCSFVHGFRVALKPSTSRMTSTERLSLIESPGGNHSPTIPQLLIPWKLLQFPRTTYKGSGSKIPQKLGVKKGSKWWGFLVMPVFVVSVVVSASPLQKTFDQQEKCDILQLTRPISSQSSQSLSPIIIIIN